MLGLFGRDAPAEAKLGCYAVERLARRISLSCWVVSWQMNSQSQVKAKYDGTEFKECTYVML